MLKTFWPFLVICLLVAVVLPHFASRHPDGLERTAEQLGFSGAESPEPVINSPLQDYAIAALGNSVLSKSLAGLIGVLVCFLLPFGFYLWRRK